MKLDHPIRAERDHDVSMHKARLARRAEARAALLPIALFLFAACLLLLLPGRTVSAIYAHDVMVYLDGAHRLLAGQLPGRDFHTPLGPFAYLLPAIGLAATHSLGAAMPAATAAFVILMAPVLAYVCLSRLSVGASLIVVAYLGLMAVAPLNPGESYRNVSFGMFYNRFCWVAIGLLFLLYAQRKPDGVGRSWIDAVCGAALALFLAYTKISYGLIAFLFLLLMAVDGRTRIVGLMAISGFAASIALIEAVRPGIDAYAADILMAAQAGGGLRNGLHGLAGALLRDLQPIGLLLVVAALMTMRGLKPITLTTIGFMLIAGLLLINQNAQQREIAVLVPAAVVALHSAEESPFKDWQTRTGLVLTALLAIPNTAQSAAALLVHAQLAARPATETAATSHIGGLVAAEDPTVGVGLPVGTTLDDIYRTGGATLPQLNLVRSLTSAQPLTQPEYLRTVQDGLALLRARPDLSGPIFVLDTANPFSALLSRRPPRGDASWHHYGRTFGDSAFVPADHMFADVSVVMAPKNPVALPSAVHLERIYGPYLRRHFRPAAESTYWRAYARRPVPA